ncbi:MAG: hypothetical protein ACXWNJ_15870 [Vulcanimicrobiaceae bacterium]
MARELTDLDAIVTFLLQPISYPEPTRAVEAVETHMSWVFLTDRFAYKLKKPVRLPYLDFSTVDLRKHYCEEEIRLNVRLAPRVYICTLPITLGANRVMTVGGSGFAIDWLVKMHRLPADRMLDRAIERGTFTADEIERLACLLSAFYREAPHFALRASMYRRRLEADVTANLEDLRKAEKIVARHRVERIHTAQIAFLHRRGKLFEQRVNERHIVEAHGDLRPEHVLLGPDPQIIDCLEFNAEFRTLDAADELAFFAMECEMLGAPAVGTTVFDRYRRDNDDAAAAGLLEFYKCYRACLRSKLAIWHLEEPNVRHPERWPELARRYLDLADIYSRRLAEGSDAYTSMRATSESPT